MIKPASATTRLQWGRRNYPAETSPRSSHSRAPSTRLQWGRRNYPAETRDHVPVRLLELFASMGPPELPGGNPHPQAARPGFNGAAGITRRKLTFDLMMEMQEIQLQWGRRNYPAETRGALAGSAIEPQRLQWGRRNYPAETRLCTGGAGQAQPCFNGAAGITRRKLGTQREHRSGGHSRFNGAAGITRRKPRRMSKDHSPLRFRFNGAAGITRRKPS